MDFHAMPRSSKSPIPIPIPPKTPLLGAFDQNVQGLRVLQNFGEHLSLLQAPKKIGPGQCCKSLGFMKSSLCYPYASCMVYEPTFGWFLGKMLVNIRSIPTICPASGRVWRDHYHHYRQHHYDLHHHHHHHHHHHQHHWYDHRLLLTESLKIGSKCTVPALLVAVTVQTES